MRITRRHVIALSAAAVGAAALGAGGLVLRWWNGPPGHGLRALSRDEYDFVNAVAEAWMPSGGTPAISGAEANVGAFFDETLDRIDPSQRELLEALLQVLDDKPIGFHLVGYRNLPLATRQRILRAWMHHPEYLFRSAVAGLMALISMGYTTHPEVARQISPWFGCGYGP